MHLEFWKSVEFKVGNERPLGIAHVALFIVQWHSINIFSSLQYGFEYADSDQLFYVGLHFVGLHLTSLYGWFIL